MNPELALMPALSSKDQSKEHIWGIFLGMKMWFILLGGILPGIHDKRYRLCLG